jgi:hypothetical protein
MVAINHRLVAENNQEKSQQLMLTLHIISVFNL